MRIKLECSNTIHNNKLQINERSKRKDGYPKTLEEIIGRARFDINRSTTFLSHHLE